MNYEQFLEQMKEDLQDRFAKDLPPELSDVRIGIRNVEKLQGESYRGLSFRSGDSWTCESMMDASEGIFMEVSSGAFFCVNQPLPGRRIKRGDNCHGRYKYFSD